MRVDQQDPKPNALLSAGQCAARGARQGVTYSRSWWRLQMLTGVLRYQRAGCGVFARCADVDALIEQLRARPGNSAPRAA